MCVDMCACVAFVFSAREYLTHFSVSHLLLLSVPFLGTSARVYMTHTSVCRVDYRLRFRVNYTFTVHALVSADFASRAVRTWFPHQNQGRSRNVCVRSPSKCEIKNHIREKNIPIKVTVKRSEGFMYESIIVIIRGYFNLQFKWVKRH